MTRAVSIRKRVWGPENKMRKGWVLDYYDQAGKRRHRTFKRKRDAEAFAETTRLLTEGSAFLDDDQLDYTIYQHRLSGGLPEPLTVRSIIYLIGKLWRANTTLSDAEQAFLTNFAADSDDRGSFIENAFLQAAIEGGKMLESYTYPMPDVDGDAGWVGLHRFFGMYVVSHTQYGEGGDEYGPFAKQKDANAAFSAVVSFCTF